MLPPKMWAPVTTLENKPDQISQCFSQRRYEPAAQEWQVSGDIFELSYSFSYFIFSYACGITFVIGFYASFYHIFSSFACFLILLVGDDYIPCFIMRVYLWTAGCLPRPSCWLSGLSEPFNILIFDKTLEVNNKIAINLLHSYLNFFFILAKSLISTSRDLEPINWEQNKP